MTSESLVLALERLLTDLPATTCCVLLGELERLKALTVMKLVAPPQGTPEVNTVEVRYLTVDQVCKRYGVKPRWLYRHKTQMPHSQPSRKVLLFPEKAVDRWFATRTSRG